MSPLVSFVLGLLTAAVVGGAWWLAVRKHVGALLVRPRERRILFPFVGSAVSRLALDAALRLAASEDATLVPAYLACVPMHLPLGATLPRQGKIAVDLFDTIEQHATRAGVPVDSRIVRGRSPRHALQTLIEQESFYRVVATAAVRELDGLSAEDIAWTLSHASGEIVVLRPDATPLQDKNANLLAA